MEHRSLCYWKPVSKKKKKKKRTFSKIDEGKFFSNTNFLRASAPLLFCSSLEYYFSPVQSITSEIFHNRIDNYGVKLSERKTTKHREERFKLLAGLQNSFHRNTKTNHLHEPPLRTCNPQIMSLDWANRGTFACGTKRLFMHFSHCGHISLRRDGLLTTESLPVNESNRNARLMCLRRMKKKKKNEKNWDACIVFSQRFTFSVFIFHFPFSIFHFQNQLLVIDSAGSTIVAE